MPRLALDFNAEVVEQQRQLNGSRYVSVEGAADDHGAAWSLSLNYGLAKDESLLDEGELTLSGPDAELFGGLQSGQADHGLDDVTGSEWEAFDLSFAIEGGEGSLRGAQGTIRLRGQFAGEEGSIRAEVEFR